MKEALLRGPIAPTLLRLALPILVALAVQTLVGVGEMYFVGHLGTDAIAGVALVFPVLMLMTMMSNGGVGGGVSSAVARAIGARNSADAEGLAVHALVVALVMGGCFSIGVWWGGRALFELMGGTGEALANAVLYANIVFAAAVPAWVANLLAAALRGAGNVRFPAIVTTAGAVATLALSPFLIFGWGPMPGLGVSGAGAALVLFNAGSALAMASYMLSTRTPLRLRRSRLEWRLFREILRVGLPSAIGTVVANLTVVVTTGLAGAFGRDAIAGYGLASRLDYLLIPLLFALGAACVTMVGTNVGAGQYTRARSIAWTSALISAFTVGAIGLVAARFPHAWMHLFSQDPEVVTAGVSYLERVAPLYPFFGAGMALYFASQGAGRIAWPLTAGIARLAVVMAAGGLWVSSVHGSLDGLYWVVALSYAIFGAINLIAMASGLGWGDARRGDSGALPRSSPGTGKVA